MSGVGAEFCAHDLLAGASGVGALLAQQLVAVGESVVDVPAALSARVRILDSGCNDQTDAHDARSAAFVGLRHANLRTVVADVLLATMVEGGLPPKLSAEGATRSKDHEKNHLTQTGFARRSSRQVSRRVPSMAASAGACTCASSRCWNPRCC